MKRYSSGMYVRLAFAVAAHLEPEILIVDEVLAVGDAAFQKKCLGKMNEVSRAGAPCFSFPTTWRPSKISASAAIVLEHGTSCVPGNSERIGPPLPEQLSGAQDASGHIVDLKDALTDARWLRTLLKRMEFYTDQDRPMIEGMQIGARLKIRVHFDLPTPTNSFNVGLGFNNVFGQRIFTAHSQFEPNRSRANTWALKFLSATSRA